MLSSPDAGGSKGERFGLGRQPIGCEAQHGLVSARARRSMKSATAERALPARTEQPLSVHAPNPHFETPHGTPTLVTPRPAPIGFDENTDPIGREFSEFYSTPRGYHANSITQ